VDVVGVNPAILCEACSLAIRALEGYGTLTGAGTDPDQDQVASVCIVNHCADDKGWAALLPAIGMGPTDLDDITSSKRGPRHRLLRPYLVVVFEEFGQAKLFPLKALSVAPERVARVEYQCLQRLIGVDL
jgi:hypothetical protein